MTIRRSIKLNLMLQSMKCPLIQDGVVEELINKADLLFQQERIDQAVDTMLKAIAVNPFGR